jgi:hypothetical protein
MSNSIDFLRIVSTSLPSGLNIQIAENKVGQRTQKQDGTQHAFFENVVVWAAVLCTKST